MSLLIESGRILIQDNGVTAFDTNNVMPHIVAQYSGTILVPAVNFNTAWGLLDQTIYTSGNQQFAQYLNPTSWQGNYYPIVFLNFSQGGGIGRVAGLENKWMQLQGGMLIRSAHGKGFTGFNDGYHPVAVSEVIWCGLNTYGLVIFQRSFIISSCQWYAPHTGMYSSVDVMGAFPATHGNGYWTHYTFPGSSLTVQYKVFVVGY